jgi:hypothetical protein
LDDIARTPKCNNSFRNPEYSRWNEGIHEIGVEMNIYETTLGNEEDVFITREQPNQPESALLNTVQRSNLGSSAAASQMARTLITANIDHTTANQYVGLETIEKRMDFLFFQWQS